MGELENTRRRSEQYPDSMYFYIRGKQTMIPRKAIENPSDSATCILQAIAVSVDAVVPDRFVVPVAGVMPLLLLFSLVTSIEQLSVRLS